MDNTNLEKLRYYLPQVGIDILCMNKNAGPILLEEENINDINIDILLEYNPNSLDTAQIFKAKFKKDNSIIQYLPQISGNPYMIDFIQDHINDLLSSETPEILLSNPNIFTNDNNFKHNMYLLLCQI